MTINYTIAIAVKLLTTVDFLGPFEGYNTQTNLNRTVTSK